MRIYELFQSVRKHLHTIGVDRSIRHRGQFYQTAECVTGTSFRSHSDGAGGGSNRLDSGRTPADPSSDPSISVPSIRATGFHCEHKETGLWSGDQKNSFLSGEINGTIFD